MSDWQRVGIDPAFSLQIPPGWVAEPDEEEGVSVYHPEGEGLLHLVAFPHPAGESADSADELYAFLEEQGIEIEEDEVEDVELPGGAALSLCEYEEENEGEAEGDGEQNEPARWLVGVATGPEGLVFVSYSAPADGADEEGEVVRRIIGTLHLRGAQ